MFYQSFEKKQFLSENLIIFLVISELKIIPCYSFCCNEKLNYLSIFPHLILRGI